MAKKKATSKAGAASNGDAAEVAELVAKEAKVLQGLGRKGYATPKAGESDREFRLRCCHQILMSIETNPDAADASFDGIVAEYNYRYYPAYRVRRRATFLTSKESVTRAMKILRDRGIADSRQGDDHRRRTWYVK